MKAVGSILAGLLLALSADAAARGVTPYLPLNLEPEMESEIERVLILADTPVTMRPIAAATVLDALPKACKVDQALCRRVQRYLARYTHTSDLSHASVEVASTHGADTPVPDRYGLHNRSVWAASAALYLQPSDYVLLNAGGVAYDGRVNPSGSFLSLGFSGAQLDIGFRPHWWSPMTDSSVLISTEAPTMPSITLSNYAPLTHLGLQYELFLARMSKSNQIQLTNGTLTSGYPKFAGVHVGIEPGNGWSLGANRILVFGGGAAGGQKIRDILKAFFDPSKSQTTGFGSRPNVAKQEASVTSRFIFPGKVPFSVYFEYAGNDTDRGRNYLLGKPVLSSGIQFPKLGPFDLVYEFSAWQNSWYVHSFSAVQNGYGDGITNYGRVIGHWFGDERQFGDAVGGKSQMLRLGSEPVLGGKLELQYRTLQNESYGPNSGYLGIAYQRFWDLALRYSHPWHGLIVGGELDTGHDVFGASFSRLAGFVRYDEAGAERGETEIEDWSGGGVEPDEKKTELFMDGGVNVYRVRTDLTDGKKRTTGPRKSGSHFALGARRAISEHSDLGTRIELDDIVGHSLMGVRLFDYRYRFDGPLALGAFLGAARYALGTPAYGFYYGGGAQWRNVLPGWDLGAEFHFADSVARDHLLSSDPQSPRPTSFYDIWGVIASISYHF